MNSVAVVSIIALVLAIVLGILKPKLNVGLIAIALSFLVGSFFAGLTDKEIAVLFPSNLFLMLVGVTSFFGVAEQNGLLDGIAARSIRLIRGRRELLPIVFFIFSFVLSAIGPGNIAATAVLAPIGMGLAYKLKANQLLMAILIVTGANAGAFSPVAPTGVILSGLASDIQAGETKTILQVFAMSALIQSVSALLAYVLFNRIQKKQEPAKEIPCEECIPLTSYQWLSVGAILTVLAATILFDVSLGLATFTGALLLMLFDTNIAEKVVARIPWETILLVTGVSILIGVMEKAGGLEMATDILAAYTPQGLIHAALAFITGLVSAYSSSSGVVMPAFIPLIPGIIEKMGAGNPVTMLIAIAVGSHMVDVSPLSTLGALCIANAKEDRQKLFQRLMIWGLSMAVFGSILSFLFLDLLI
ncbi:C4-dicarboxylate ABC transporter [Candidatus Roizmanbacteria bacterium]|nr:MAG: C4-dicarboxylate ABC transporter [Candidatus Roizmanbacteria bacterium]